MKKSKKIKKVSLSKETLRRIDSEKLPGVGGDYTGPSCEIFRVCTVAGLGC